jgi:hypothetical protein
LIKLSLVGATVAASVLAGPQEFRDQTNPASTIIVISAFINFKE